MLTSPVIPFTRRPFLSHPSIRLLALALLLVVGGTVLSGCAGAEPADVVRDFTDALADGELERAADLTTMAESAEMRRKLISGLGQGTAQIEQQGGINDFEVLSESVNGERASVSTRTTYGNGTTQNQDWTLTKLDGDWKINPTGMDK
jgi:hypothetical protein